MPLRDGAEMQTIAFVGLGAMGLPMAVNLLTKGHTVRGVDISDVSKEKFEAAGGTFLRDAREAANGADVLILMVVNAAQAEQVLFETQALDALAANATVVVMATCAQAVVQSMAKRVQETGRSFIDAPVSGGVVGAESGGLTIMVGCEKAVFEANRPILQAMGERIFHVGEAPGQGAMVKTINQLLCGVHIAVAAEAFAMADKAGIELQTLLEIMSGSAASSWMLQNRGPRMLQTEPPVTSAVDIFVKDLSIVLQTGQDLRAALPIAAAAQQMYIASSGRGDGKADDSQVIRTYRALNQGDKS
jgi:3-hydroxyisobutyrate dehydrogenase